MKLSKAHTPDGNNNQLYTHTHTCTHAYMHTHTYTHAYAYTHTERISSPVFALCSVPALSPVGNQTGKACLQPLKMAFGSLLTQ